MGNTQTNEKQSKGKSPGKGKQFIKNLNKKSPGRDSKKRGRKKSDGKRDVIDREFDKTPESDINDAIDASDTDMVECAFKTLGEGESASVQSEVTVSRRSATRDEPPDRSTSDSVFTEPLTPLAAAVELNQCYYSAESSAHDEPPRTLTPPPPMPHDDATSSLSTEDLEKEEKSDVFNDSSDTGEDEKVMGNLFSGLRTRVQLEKSTHECNHEFRENRLKASPGQTSFTISRHRKVELTPVTCESSLVLDNNVVEEERQTRASGGVGDAPMGDSNVLRKVASITLNKHKETKVVRPKFVPEKLDFQLYEKFEGQMLLNWFLSSLSEDNQLGHLSSQDLRRISIQFCTDLLAAGVLRQIADSDAPIENIFKPSLMYYWTRMEAPTSQPVTPGRLHMPSAWPPDRETYQEFLTNTSNYTCYFNDNNNEEITDLTEAKALISKLKQKLEELQFQLELEKQTKTAQKESHLENLQDLGTKVNKEVQTSNSEINKPVIKNTETDSLRENVNNVDISSVFKYDKQSESILETRSEKVENYCKLNKSRDFIESKSDLRLENRNYCESEKDLNEISEESEDNSYVTTLESFSDRSNEALTSSKSDILREETYKKSSNLPSNTQILYSIVVKKHSTSPECIRSEYSQDDLNSKQTETKLAQLPYFKDAGSNCASQSSTNICKSLVESSDDDDARINATTSVSEDIVSSSRLRPRLASVTELKQSTEEEDSLSLTSYLGLLVGSSQSSSMPVELSESPPKPLSSSPVASMQGLDLSHKTQKPARDTPTSQGMASPPPPPPMHVMSPPIPPPMPSMGPTPPPHMPEMGPPPPSMLGIGPPPPPMPGTCPPPPPMPGMGPPPPPMSGVGPPPPPMPGMGPPPPPMPGMGPPPPPMPGMGPPPPPMPGMGPPPPPMPGMGPPPPPMPGMGPPPPPMPGMGPPPPPMTGMGPPPPPMSGMGPPPPSLPGAGPPAPPGPGGPIPFPAPPVGGWTMQRATLRKTPVKPAAPMKPLYWTRILAAPVPVVGPDETHKSKPLWLEIEETPLDNIDEFTDLFSRQVVKAPVKKKVATKSTKIQPAKILDSKRSQNVGILAQSLHVEFSEIENAIYNFDTSVVSLEALQQIYELRANEEELALIKEHLKSKPEIPLDRPEAFLHDLSGIPHFAERISCFMFQAEFEDSVNTTMHKLDNLKHTCEFLITSEALKKLFAIILTLGNYMNGGNGQRGQADGFGLEILAKLKDVKSKQSNVTLLHFIVRTYMRACGGALAAACALPVPEPGDVARAAATDFADVAASLDACSRQLQVCKEKTKTVLESHEKPQSPSEEPCPESTKRLDVFREKMSTFMNAAEEKLKTEYENLEECRSKFVATVKFYQYTPKCGKLEECEPNEFFSLWTSFCTDFKDIFKKEEQLAIKEKLKEAKKIKEERKTLTQPKKEGGLKSRLQKLSSARKS